jgi:hypothetical protein
VNVTRVKQRCCSASAAELFVFADAAFAFEVVFVSSFGEEFTVFHVLPNLL